MVDQHMQIFLPEKIDFLHIGADEVFNLATCTNCRYFVEEAGKNTLYSKFVKKVTKRIQEKYPHTQIMIWDDMFRNWNFQDMRKFAMKNGK